MEMRFRTVAAREGEAHPFQAPRAHIEAIDGEGSDVTVEVVQMSDDDGFFWAVTVTPFGPRTVRVYAGSRLEPDMEWQDAGEGGTWVS